MAAEFAPREALKFWHDVMLELVRRGEADLSARQIVVLLTVHLEEPPHTVRGLAAKLGVAKPVITRALDTMGKLGLLERRRDEADKRNVLVVPTAKGEAYVERLGMLIAARAKKAVR